MTQLIDTKEFIQCLKNEGLVIISQKELDRISVKKLMVKRDDLLSKKSLTLKEILSLEILPVKSKQALRTWIKDGKILQKEVTVLDSGIIKIQTSFLYRLGYVI